MRRRSIAMSARKIDPDNPVWTAKDFRRAKPASELPAEVLKAFPRTRGPQRGPTKVPVSIRLSPEVVDHFKGGGKGWQARIDETLAKAVRDAKTGRLSVARKPPAGRAKRIG
jgi:uncharacterized protein (DUF4415 family)